LGLIMCFDNFIKHLPHFQMHHFAVAALIMPPWSIPVFCGPIHNAASLGNPHKVQALLKENPELVSSRDRESRTPLHIAAEMGYRNLAELLLANDADVNARNKESWTPLHWAAERGEKIAAELLLARGTDGDATNIPSGATLNPDPIHVTKQTPGSHREGWAIRTSTGAYILLITIAPGANQTTTPNNCREIETPKAGDSRQENHSNAPTLDR
jgi:ankyrin repeat protein